MLRYLTSDWRFVDDQTPRDRPVLHLRGDPSFYTPRPVPPIAPDPGGTGPEGRQTAAAQWRTHATWVVSTVTSHTATKGSHGRSILMIAFWQIRSNCIGSRRIRSAKSRVETAIKLVIAKLFDHPPSQQRTRNSRDDHVLSRKLNHNPVEILSKCAKCRDFMRSRNMLLTCAFQTNLVKLQYWYFMPKISSWRKPSILSL